MSEAAYETPARVGYFSTPWGDGYDHAKAGGSLNDCPHPVDTDTKNHADWVSGWWDGWQDWQE